MYDNDEIDRGLLGTVTVLGSKATRGDATATDRLLWEQERAELADRILPGYQYVADDDDDGDDEDGAVRM